MIRIYTSIGGRLFFLCISGNTVVARHAGLVIRVEVDVDFEDVEIHVNDDVLYDSQIIDHALDSSVPLSRRLVDTIEMIA